MKKIITACCFMFALVATGVYAQSPLPFLNQTASTAHTAETKCYAENSNFCSCMSSNQINECKKQIGGSWCTIGNVIMGVKQAGIETVCKNHFQTSSGPDYENCLQGLYCFIYGATINGSHRCKKKCSY